MSKGNLVLGSTVLLPSTHHNPDKHHLCIVLNDPQDENGRQVVYVPIITARRKYDSTCVLDVGDHPFIKHKSCVHYAAMGQRSETHLLKIGKINAPLKPSVVQRVIAGVVLSPHAAPWARNLLAED